MEGNTGRSWVLVHSRSPRAPPKGTAVPGHQARRRQQLVKTKPSQGKAVVSARRGYGGTAKGTDKHGDGKSFINIFKFFSALADFPCLALHAFQIKTENLQEGTTQHSSSSMQNLRPRQSWGCPQPSGTSRMPGATLAEVSVRQHQRSHQRPEVEQEPGPAGADLHPHGRPGARQHPQALIRPETANKQAAPITVLHLQGGMASMAGSNCTGEGWRLRAPSHRCNAKSTEERAEEPRACSHAAPGSCLQLTQGI